MKSLHLFFAICITLSIAACKSSANLKPNNSNLKPQTSAHMDSIAQLLTDARSMITFGTALRIELEDRMVVLRVALPTDEYWREPTNAAEVKRMTCLEQADLERLVNRMASLNLMGIDVANRNAESARQNYDAATTARDGDTDTELRFYYEPVGDSQSERPIELRTYNHRQNRHVR